MHKFADFVWPKESYRYGIEEQHIPRFTHTNNYFATGVYTKQKGGFPDSGPKLAGAGINTDLKLPDRIQFGKQFTVWKRNATLGKIFGGGFS